MDGLNNNVLGSPDFENAVLCYDPSIEPGGILFYSGDKD